MKTEIEKQIAGLELDLDNMLLEMKHCKLQMQDGIDYDYNQDTLDELSQQYLDKDFELSCLRRKLEG